MKKVLVIDDDNALRSDLLTILELEGYEAVAADNGREGVLAAQNHRPDLILCDITMPVLDGFGVITELRQNPQTAGIPVIFLTARNEKPFVQRGAQLGAAGYSLSPMPWKTY